MCAQAEPFDSAGIPFASAEAVEGAAERPAGALSMNEAAFRLFYEKTATRLRAYLVRATGDASTADDLLQECYLRLLRAPLAPTEEAHRRNYLFRMATNLLTDHFRRTRHSFTELPEIASPQHAAEDFEKARDMEQFLSELKPRERALLWLAYVEGYRHEEIAGFLGCRAASVRPMLFRARERLAGILRARGWKRKRREEGPS